MEDGKIRDGIDQFIGKDRMMTNELRNRILLNTQNASKSKRGAFMKFVRPVLSIAILLIVFGGMYYLVTNEKDEGETAASGDENELLEKTLAENKELKETINTMYNEAIPRLQETLNEIARLEQQVEALSKSNSEESQLDFWAGNTLKKLNFEGNEKDIIAELLPNWDIIPYDGILGGTMILLAEGAKVLSHEWIFVPFSDGHTAGYLLVEYKIKDGEPTDWKVIDSYILGDEDK